MRRTQEAGSTPERRSAWSRSRRTTRVRTRSRPTAYGGSSARTSATRSASSPAGIRRRYDPSGTVRSPTPAVLTRAYSARRSTSAMRGSCLTDAVFSGSVPVTGWRAISSSRVDWRTPVSPREGSTSAM